MRFLIFLFLFVGCYSEVAETPLELKATSAIYVSPDGNDYALGTIAQPLATLGAAINKWVAGTTIYLRGGEYYSESITITKSGAMGQYLRIFNYPNEVPVINFNGNKGLEAYNKSYIYFKGVEFTNASGITFNLQNCNFIKVEKCKAYGSGGSGFYSYRSGKIDFINCDAYDNYDQNDGGYSGGQADGFVVCYHTASSNVLFKGCRSWYNSDDGYDCWDNNGTVTFDSCWAFNNGRDQGDGNGFKLGKVVSPSKLTPQRILKHCLAYDNRANGFDQNGANVIIKLINCSASANDGDGFSLPQFLNANILKNNYTLTDEIDIASSSKLVKNKWNVSPSNFVNLDGSQLELDRENGRLPKITFLHLNSGSVLIDAGAKVGLPFNGLAPDIGCFEF